MGVIEAGYCAESRESALAIKKRKNCIQKHSTAFLCVGICTATQGHTHTILRVCFGLQHGFPHTRQLHAVRVSSYKQHTLAACMVVSTAFPSNTQALAVTMHPRDFCGLCSWQHARYASPSSLQCIAMTSKYHQARCCIPTGNVGVSARVDMQHGFRKATSQSLSAARYVWRDSILITICMCLLQAHIRIASL